MFNKKVAALLEISTELKTRIKKEVCFVLSAASVMDFKAHLPLKPALMTIMSGGDTESHSQMTTKKLIGKYIASRSD